MDQDYGGCESAHRVQEEAQKQDGTGTNSLPSSMTSFWELQEVKAYVESSA